MRKKILSAAFAVMIMTVAGFNVYMNQAKSNLSEMALANIEALADPETEEMINCTKGEFGSCYDSKGKWQGTYVKYVTPYQVPKNSILICYHHKVTSCPDGTTPGNDD